MNLKSGPPSPEELQRQFQDLLRQHLKPGAFGFGGPETAAATAETPGAPGPKEKPFRFDLKPKDVKAYLDRFVIRQDEAKKVLSVALCDHYHHVRMAQEGQAQPNYAKQNILLMGPTGVGKTYLVRSMADLIGVPFVKADATKFSETGYVGGDVEDLVRDLVRQAEGDVARAEYGIIYIDEIDKIAASTGVHGRDVSGRGVQTNLLKLMEETEVPARAPNDLAGQIQAMMDMSQRGGKKQPSTINTKHILFVVSGAFDGLESITRKRLREASIGFAAKERTTESTEQVLERAQTRDYIDFGFEPEFIGRLPVRVLCRNLAVEDLYQILKSSEGSIIRQYEQTFGAYGLEVLFRDEGLRRVAELAAEEKTGARGLMTVCERVFREFKFELPSSPVKRFEVTRATVDQPAEGLAQLLKEHELQCHRLGHALVREFEERFVQAHGIRIEFSEDAAERLVVLAGENGKSVRDFCVERFKDFHFGLKLIVQNTGTQQFRLGCDAVEAPEKTLSEWVVRSYRPSQPPESAGAEPAGEGQGQAPEGSSTPGTAAAPA